MKDKFSFLGIFQFGKEDKPGTVYASNAYRRKRRLKKRALRAEKRKLKNRSQ